MASAAHEEPPRSYQPPFDSQDADIVLRSAGGTYYRIPSFTLRATSGFFRTMLSLPQNGDTQKDDPIPVNEKDNVLERVLRMISGLEIPKWESFDQVDEVLLLVENWDTPGPLAIIRSAITSPLFLAEPLRLYVIATHFEWEEEAKLASKYTLSLSLYNDEYQAILQRLSARHLLSLLSFHRKRRDLFGRFIDSEEPFNVGNASPYHCIGCGEEMDNHTWRDLKAKLFLEMDQRPLGDTLCGLDMDEWPESVACWNAKCKKEGCGKPNYNKGTTLKSIKSGIDGLPPTI